MTGYFASSCRSCDPHCDSNCDSNCDSEEAEIVRNCQRGGEEEGAVDQVH